MDDDKRTPSVSSILSERWKQTKKRTWIPFRKSCTTSKTWSKTVYSVNRFCFVNGYMFIHIFLSMKTHKNLYLVHLGDLQQQPACSGFGSYHDRWCIERTRVATSYPATWFLSDLDVGQHTQTLNVWYFFSYIWLV